MFCFSLFILTRSPFIVHSSLFLTHYELFIVHYPRSVHYSLFISSLFSFTLHYCYLLSLVRYLLFAVHYSSLTLGVLLLTLGKARGSDDVANTLKSSEKSISSLQKLENTHRKETAKPLLLRVSLSTFWKRISISHLKCCFGVVCEMARSQMLAKCVKRYAFCHFAIVEGSYCTQIISASQNGKLH